MDKLLSRMREHKRKFFVLMYYLPSLLFPLVGSPLGAVCIRDMTSSHYSASSNSRISITHFPSGLNQCRKVLNRGDIYFLKAERAYKKTQLTVKPDSSGFWTFWTLKLTNFETRFWTRDTCHVGSEDTM